jgi:4-amino-4-deoxychorismate lyase
MQTDTLLETVKCVDGKPLHLGYHQKRCDDSLQKMGIHRRYELSRYLEPPKNGLYRCRILYDAHNLHVEYFPYVFAPPSSLRAINSDINYDLKYANRENLDALFSLRSGCDDVAIIKNNLLTDTTKANIALFDETMWYTPKTPLLFGTTRARLLESAVLKTCTIALNEIQSFSKVAVMNAMIGFCIVENGIITEYK